MSISTYMRQGLTGIVGATGARQILNGLNEQFNVQNYGAEGNGVADDTAAIQRAIDAAVEAGGGVVVLPKGTYIVQDPTTAVYGSNRPGIEIPAAARDITIIGWGATIKIGANGCSNSAICIYGARCSIIGLTVDVNYVGATQGEKDNTGIEVNGSNDEGVQGTDCTVEFCRVIGGDTSNNLSPNQGSEAIKFTNATNCYMLFCHAQDCTFQAFRVAGSRNRLIGCTADNFRGNGIRVVAGTDLWIESCHLTSDRNAGRHCIIIDPGAQADPSPSDDSDVRMYRIVIRDCYLYSNTDGSQENPAVGCSVLKLASSYDTLVEGCTIIAGKASTSSTNDALRLEDSLYRVTIRNCYIYPTVVFTPAGTSGGVFMGPIGSTVTNSGGFCQYSATNGLSSAGVGKTLFVRGSTVTDYNGPQTITAVSGSTITTDRMYRSASIGSNCVAHTGVDEVYFEQCVFDGIHNLQVYHVWNATARVLSFEECTFRAAEATTAKKGAIECDWTSDLYYDLFRIVRCKFFFNSDKLQKCINPNNTTGGSLVTSGKVIAYGNTYENRYNNGSSAPGAVVFANPYASDDSTATYAERAVLFNTEGENPNRFRGTAKPSSAAFTWARGDVVVNTTPSAAGAPGFVCVTAGAGSASNWRNFAVLET